MPNFFIDRPVFAWVISILICLGGVISMLNMGVAAFPDIAPPQVTVNADLPRRQCRHHGIDGHAGHRAAAHRHR